MRAVGSGLLLLMVIDAASSRPLHAQTPCPSSTMVGAVYPCALDPWAGAEHQPIGAYPALLLQERVEGRVHLRVLVDTLGRTVPSTLQARATHDLFVTAVRRRISEWRFAPPRRAGRPIGVWYEATFTFLPVPLAGHAEVDVVPGPDTVSSSPPTVDPNRWPSLADTLRIPDALVAAQEVILRLFTEQLDTLPRRPTVCLHALGGQTPQLTIALSTRTLTVTRPAYCPRTYTSMFRIAGRRADRPPPGYQDPVALRVFGIEEVRPGVVRVFIEQGQGMSGQRYTCGARRVDLRWTDAACTAGRRFSH